jgi:DNA repair protein RecO
MIEEKTLAITLKSTPFKDRSKIVKLLTLDLGIITTIVNISNKKSSTISFSTPFTVSDIVIRKKNSDIYNIKDLKIINSNLHLRENLTYLKIASKMILSILKSQFPIKNSKNIFSLLLKYLENIKINPEAIYLSFLLKILLNESIIKPSDKCNICSSDALAIDGGESICLKCSNKSSYILSENDYKTYLVLSKVRSFKYLKDLEINLNFSEKICSLFNELT